MGTGSLPQTDRLYNPALLFHCPQLRSLRCVQYSPQTLYHLCLSVFVSVRRGLVPGDSICAHQCLVDPSTTQRTCGVLFSVVSTITATILRFRHRQYTVGQTCNTLANFASVFLHLAVSYLHQMSQVLRTHIAV